MGTKTGTNIIDRARHILQDTTSGGVRWLDDELLDWINDAQREIAIAKPSASSTVADVTLTADTTVQQIPSDGIMLLSVVRNQGGPAVRRVDRDVMDSENTAWHTATGNATVDHYIYDEDTPEYFWVYPPQPAVSPGTVTIIYSKLPTDLSTKADTIDLSDIYVSAILDYVLYRAYSKDTDYAGSQQRAANHYNAFANSLGLKKQEMELHSPIQNIKTERAAGSN